MRVPHHAALLCAAASCLVLSAAASARAARPEDLGLAFETAVKDEGTPALVLKPRVGVKAATFALQGPGGEQVLKVGAVRAGGAARMRFAHGEGKATYRGSAEVTWADGKRSEYGFEFEAVRYRTLTMQMTWEDVDLERRVATCRASHDVASLSVRVEASDGRVLAEAEERFDPPAPGGSELAVRWEAAVGEAEPPARITVKVTDALGVWASMKATPFTIDIPHDEVEFALGESVIRPGEVPKLEKTLDDLRAALKRHGTLLDLKLFIAGFTDTVGPAGANVALSVRRAAAIAAWFRKRGVRLAIYYRGFGEVGLAVPTPDETDEARNRRALYILSVHPPLGVRVAGADADAAAGWVRL